MTTPVSTWAPAFDQARFPWLKNFPIEQVFSDQLKDYRLSGQYQCRLCDQLVFKAGLESHAARHHEEFRAWTAEQKAQQEMAA